jgi:hypothetical protein
MNVISIMILNDKDKFGESMFVHIFVTTKRICIMYYIISCNSYVYVTIFLLLDLHLRVKF